MARWLLQLHDRVPGDLLPVTHDVLAQLLGVRRTTVTLTMSKLRQAGAVPSDRRGFIEIDRARLERVACDCYALMQRNIDRMYCQELAGPQPAHPPFRQSAVVASDGAGGESRAVSRAGK
jgi:DNA-binding transcriptional ArsR family regulator